MYVCIYVCIFYPRTDTVRIVSTESHNSVTAFNMLQYPRALLFPRYPKHRKQPCRCTMLDYPKASKKLKKRSRE